MDGLSLEELKERIDHLQARVNETEGGGPEQEAVWAELRHLQQVYDQQIRDSQGQGIQMMQDIMDKSPETRDNYTGVPVATTQSPAIPSAPPPAPLNAAVPHAEPDGDEGPVINLTINLPGGISMEPSIDAAAIARSQGGDIRIPLDMQARLEKARRGSKPEKKDSVDGIDQDKIRAAKESGKEEGDEEEKEKPETDESHKSFYRAETETLQKSLLARGARVMSAAAGAGAWVSKRLQKACDLDIMAKAMRVTLEKAAGSALVMGVKAPASAEAKKAAYASIVALNCEIQRLNEQIQDCNEPDEQVKLNAKLRAVYEKLAIAVMQSEGMGLKTEDMSCDKPDTRFPEKMTETAVGKSQKGDLEKASKHYTGKLASGARYALTVWDAEGGLGDEQDKAVIAEVASTDKAIARRLRSKLPALPKMRDEEHIYVGHDGDAPIRGGGNKGGKTDKTERVDCKPQGNGKPHGDGSKKPHHDRRVGSPDHPGRHGGDMKHIVRASGSSKGHSGGGKKK